MLLEEGQQTKHQRIETLQKWIKVIDGEMGPAELANSRKDINECIWIEMSKVIFNINCAQKRQVGPYLGSEIVVQETLGILEEFYLLKHLSQQKKR